MYINSYLTSNIFGHRVGISNIQNTFDKENHEMKMGLHNYAIIMLTESGCIKLNNDKIHSLQTYNKAIKEFYTKLFRVCLYIKPQNFEPPPH
jgi:hypothetical protein